MKMTIIAEYTPDYVIEEGFRDKRFFSIIKTELDEEKINLILDKNPKSPLELVIDRPKLEQTLEDFLEENYLVLTGWEKNYRHWIYYKLRRQGHGQCHRLLGARPMTPEEEIYTTKKLDMLQAEKDVETADDEIESLEQSLSYVRACKAELEEIAEKHWEEFQAMENPFTN